MQKKQQGKSGMNRRCFLKGCFGSACALSGAASVARASVPDPGAQRAKKGLLGFRRSPWFEQIEGRNLRCTLCPRSCRISAGKRGFCMVRGNWEGTGYSLVYGNPAMVQIDPIERKPYYHVLPASRSLSVATAGCNVRCKFCEVWDMALVAPDEIYAYELSPEEVVHHARESGVRSLAFTFGEPVVFYEYMLDCAKKAVEAGLLALFHSNGYINRAPLEELCEVIDGANIDLKAFDPDFYKEIVGGELGPVLETLKFLKEKGAHIEITNLIIPALNDKLEDIREMSRWIKNELGASTPLHFNRFYPLYKLSNLPQTPVSTLEKARDAARKIGMDYVYIGNVTGHSGQHTHCANCGEEIIHRVGFMIDEPRMSNGRCKFCGQEVPGLWT